jgi:hypothetical protein
MQKGKPHNPFALSELEPHRTAYIFDAKATLEHYVHQLDTHGWNAELVGPHGVGKTTLMHTLARAVESRGRRVVHFKCSDDRPRLPLGWSTQLIVTRPHIVCLDGGERIRRAQLRQLEVLCRALHIGLLSTAHAPQRPVLQFVISCNAEQLWSIVNRDRTAREFLGAPSALSAALAECNFSARDCLNLLYDRYEAASSSALSVEF